MGSFVGSSYVSTLCHYALSSYALTCALLISLPISVFSQTLVDILFVRCEAPQTTGTPLKSNQALEYLSRTILSTLTEIDCAKVAETPYHKPVALAQLSRVHERCISRCNNKPSHSYTSQICTSPSVVRVCVHISTHTHKHVMHTHNTCTYCIHLNYRRTNRKNYQSRRARWSVREQLAGMQHDVCKRVLSRIILYRRVQWCEICGVRVRDSLYATSVSDNAMVCYCVK